jgi:hypothetical protein
MPFDVTETGPTREDSAGVLRGLAGQIAQAAETAVVARPGEAVPPTGEAGVGKPETAKPEPAKPQAVTTDGSAAAEQISEADLARTPRRIPRQGQANSSATSTTTKTSPTISLSPAISAPSSEPSKPYQFRSLLLDRRF